MVCPNIITGDGVYVTRGGRLVFISGAENDPKTNNIRYSGYIHVIHNHISAQEWHTWASDGRFSLKGDHTHDIINKV